MRRIILISLVVTLVLSLACNSRDNSYNESPTSPETKTSRQQTSQQETTSSKINVSNTQKELPAPTQPSNAVNNLVQTKVESTTGSMGGETYSPIFEGQFDFELSTGLQINKEDVLTGRPVFMLSVSEY